MPELRAILDHPDFWKYVSIPFIAGIVGWFTNWIAIKMTFVPLEFIGIRPIFGWQGIIPSKATKMASTFVDTTMSRLGRLSEVFEQMDPQRMAAHVAAVMDKRLDDYTDEVALQGNAVLWENLPEVVKAPIYDSVRQAMPSLIEDLMREIGENVEELLDFKYMIVNRLETDKALLNRLFLEAGKAEFRFIVHSGLYFGFLFGLVQLAVWVVLPAWWVLPLFGLVVGWATNWLALNIIFRPLFPKKIGPWTLQGLFLKRQKEVAGAWCHLVTREMITVKHLTHALLHGPRSERVRALIRRRIRPVVDDAMGLVRPVAQLAVGPRGYADLKQAVADKALHVSADPFEDLAFNEERAVVVEDVMRARMETMPPDQFQDLLRPCFQEDEMKLILAGAVLGLLAGIAQLVFVFGG